MLTVLYVREPFVPRQEFHGQSFPPLVAPSEGGDYQCLCSAWVVSIKSSFHGILPVSFVFREQNNSPIHWKKLQPARNLRTSIFSTWILTSTKVSVVWSRYWPKRKVAPTVLSLTEQSSYKPTGSRSGRVVPAHSDPLTALSIEER